MGEITVAVVPIVVEQRHIEMAKSADACSDALKVLKVGMNLEDVPSQFLEWFESRFPDEARRISALAAKAKSVNGIVPLSLYGYGSGDGYGYGYGSGYGDGSGYGYGYGYGYGDGSGDGSGYGDGASRQIVQSA
jgi:hypothetical protein